jgi:hypothetical protein
MNWQAEQSCVLNLIRVCFELGVFELGVNELLQALVSTMMPTVMPRVLAAKT